MQEITVRRGKHRGEAPVPFGPSDAAAMGFSDHFIERIMFRPIRDELGDYARSLYEDFTVEPETWGGSGSALPEGDQHALQRWIEFEGTVPLIEVPYEIDGDDRKALSNALDGFHLALPFSEAERIWLRDTASHVPFGSTSAEVIAAEHGTISSGGIQTPISGEPLLRRWGAWRREADEYAGQGALVRACGALQDLQRLLP